MKKQKLTLKGVKNALSRDEMKKIMAGSGSCRLPGQTCDNYFTFCCPNESCYNNGSGGYCYVN